MKKEDSLPILNPHAAGIDVGSQKMFASVGGGAPRVFGSCTADLRELRDWLREQKVATVAMEATGVYWLCLFGILEEAGMEVIVVNGAHVKSLPGRKSDMQDCQWLAMLHSRGLLRGGFVPASEIRRLRDCQRLRSDLVTMASTHVQHMQKALERLNLKIHTVISSIIGVSGLAMIKAIVGGERDAEALLELCDDQILEKKKAALRKALEGNWQPEHIFALRMALEGWQFYQRQIQECDAELGARVAEMAQGEPAPELAPKKELRNNAPKNLPELQKHLAQIYGADLTRIPGLNHYTVMLLLSEVGWEMNRWGGVKQFTAWLGVAPATRQSGKRRRREKRHMGRAGRIFCLAAQSMAMAKKSWLGSFYRRIRATRGGPVAIKATARKIAQLFYLVLTKGWDYVEQGIAEYQRRYREGQMRRLKRLASELGMTLAPTK
ncbi:MAG TPA: IS110 family transposase [Verrucomicrobiae bacterium]|nr:IS110 family transposase [Verrucomicrobiae bacterium]